MIRRKIYISRAAGEISEEAIPDILATSRKNNMRDDLTGLLIFDQGMFFQILEGPEPALERCFARIVEDPRHGNVRLMSDTEQDARAFPDWKMGYAVPRDLDPRGRAIVERLGALSQDDRSGLVTRNVQDMIEEFLAVFESSHDGEDSSLLTG